MAQHSVPSPTVAPHASDPHELSLALGTNPDVGLTAAAAAGKLRADGPNIVGGDAPPSLLARLGHQFRNPLVGLLIVAVAISTLAWVLDDEGGWPIDAIVIGFIVVANAVLGVAQEYRADRAVAALATMTSARATVRRDGRSIRVPTSEVVVGDVLLLEAGDVVAADARLVVNAGLQVSEALLTGESEPVFKATSAVDATSLLADRTSMAHAGTSVVSGRCTALVTATGTATAVGEIARMLAETERPPTPLEKEIAGVGRVLGTAVVIISIVIAGVTALSSSVDSISDVVAILLIGVSIAVAAVPEGLPAVLSLVLALGVQRMARRNALVKRLASAETLGAASVIFTDKTGTLTRNEMAVRRIALSTGCVTVGDTPGDGFQGPDGNATDAATAELARAALGAAALASDAAPDGSGATDPTEQALVRAADAMTDGLRLRRIAELPFTPERRRMSVLVAGADDEPDSRWIFTKGAPDELLDRCSHELLPGGERRVLTGDARDRWTAAVDQLANDAMRTMLVARRRIEVGREGLHEGDETELTVLGVVGLIDPPRAEAGEAVAAAAEAGIRVIMLTGDHPRTAAAIARLLAIGQPGEVALTGHDIDAVDDDDLKLLLREHSVFARVAPAHKLRMVQLLQSDGHVVAMTGDGVNDAPALKAADIGTAMGASGTEVAREAADMVLTDDDFSTIIAAVAAGRTIFRNIRSFLRYLLSSNVGEVLTMFAGVLFAGALGLRGQGDQVIAPLTAAQILWINLLTDTGPALALGLDRPDDATMRHPPRRRQDRVIDAPMQRGIGLVGLTMAVATLLTLDAMRPGGLIEGSADLETARTAAFTVLVLAQLFNCFSARSEHRSAFRDWASNPTLLAAIGVSLALQIAVVHVPFLQQAFKTTDLTVTEWLMATLVASSVLWVAEARKVLSRRAP